MRTTLKDIAKRTGLSTTSVSLVLNGKPCSIPKKTKNLILRTAKEMNYRPNQLAVGLTKKRTKTIGLIVSDISNVFFGILAKGVEDECRVNGWTVILCNTNDKHERDIEYIKVLADKGVDGIVFDMSGDSDIEKAKESCNLMDSLRVPFVMIDRYIENINCCSVAVDHYTGGLIATKHLLSLNRKRIGCITGPKSLLGSNNRLKGYIDAIKLLSVNYDPKLIYEGDYTIESGIKAAEYFIDKDIEAVFAFNDLMAYGAYYQLKKNNVSVPDEVSIVGYDDVFMSKFLGISLTSVKQPVYEMGQEAARQLFYQINQKDVEHEELKKRILFKPTLSIRDSTKILIKE